jgi:hypothetical protein
MAKRVLDVKQESDSKKLKVDDIHQLILLKNNKKMALTIIANEFVQGLYLRYPSDETQNAISSSLYDKQQLSGFLNTFELQNKDYFIETLLDHSMTVFLYNLTTNTYERVQSTIPFVPAASTTYHKDKHFLDLDHHGKRGDKKPLEKTIHEKKYIGNHWLEEYIYTYSPVLSS